MASDATLTMASAHRWYTHPFLSRCWTIESSSRLAPHSSHIPRAEIGDVHVPSAEQ